MATYELKNPAVLSGHGENATNPFNRIFSFVTNLFVVSEEKRVYQETVRELERLSDRDLSDLGFARSDIRAIAREAAHAKHANV